MIKYLKDNKNIIFLLCLFMTIQPFLDMKVLFDNQHLMIFGITIPTIVRTLFIGLIGILTFYKDDNKRERKFIIFYFIILMIYSLLHHLVVSKNLDVPSSFSYSFISELFYVIRMILPIALIYIIRKVKIDYEKFINVILYSSIIIGLVIIIMNTFLISYNSYPLYSMYTKANWLTWIFGDLSIYEFEDLASKGWFYMANQVAGLTILLLPLCLGDMVRKHNIKNILASFLLTFAMIILGTRTSAYGWIIAYVGILIGTIILYMFKFTKTINYKGLNYLVIFLVICLSLLLVSPIKTREFAKDKSTDYASCKIYEDKDTYGYIESCYPHLGIQKVYIEDLYSYKYDYIFWLDMFDRSKETMLDNRDLEIFVSERISSKNSNIIYDLFGYSFSRMRNGGIYIEKDIYAQKITVGYIGVIVLFFPYIMALFAIGRDILKNRKFNILYLSFGISIIGLFGSSLFTGHILDELFVMLYVGFIIGFFGSIIGKEIEE